MFTTTLGGNMILVLETTKWGGSNTPNHVYLLSDDKYKMYGYIRKGSRELKMFNKPYPFDKRNRTFKLLKSNLKAIS